MRNPNEDWVTIERVASTLATTVQTIYVHQRSGRIPFVRLGDNVLVPRTWLAHAQTHRTAEGAKAKVDWEQALAGFLADEGLPTTLHIGGDLPADIGEHEVEWIGRARATLESKARQKAAWLSLIDKEDKA